MTKYTDIVDAALGAPRTMITQAENEQARARYVQGYAELAKAEQARISNLINAINSPNMRSNDYAALRAELMNSIIG